MYTPELDLCCYISHIKRNICQRLQDNKQQTNSLQRDHRKEPVNLVKRVNRWRPKYLQLFFVLLIQGFYSWIKYGTLHNTMESSNEIPTDDTVPRSNNIIMATLQQRKYAESESIKFDRMGTSSSTGINNIRRRAQRHGHWKFWRSGWRWSSRFYK